MSIRECERILADREWVNLYMATRECPLSYNALLAHGYLRRRRKAEHPPDYRTIADATGINRTRTTPACVKELVDHGLAARDGRGYRAIDPGPKHITWFARRSDGKGSRFYRVYILARDAPLTSTANALYWLMTSLAGHKLSDGTARLKRNTRSGLAALAGISRNTVKAALRSLEGLGLFREDDGLEVLAPRPAIHDWAVTSLINPLELPGHPSLACQEGPLYAG